MRVHSIVVVPSGGAEDLNNTQALQKCLIFFSFTSASNTAEQNPASTHSDLTYIGDEGRSWGCGRRSAYLVIERLENLGYTSAYLLFQQCWSFLVQGMFILVFDGIMKGGYELDQTLSREDKNPISRSKSDNLSSVFSFFRPQHYTSWETVVDACIR